MNTPLLRRLSALETAGGVGAEVIEVMPVSVAADPARKAAWWAAAERRAPPGARIVAVLTGVPRAGDPQ